MQLPAKPKRLTNCYLLARNTIATFYRSLCGKSNNLVTFHSFVFAPDVGERNEKYRNNLRTMKALFLIILSVVLAIGSVQAQTLLTQTTWGGTGSDVADGVAGAAD